MQSDPRFSVFSKASFSYGFMFFNLMRPFIGGASNFEWLEVAGKEDYTKALAVRKAICYAIDRDEMNRVFFDEEAIVCHSCIVPTIARYHYDDIIKYHQDLDASYEWLYAAGYYVEPVETPLKLLNVIASIGAAAILIILSRKSKKG